MTTPFWKSVRELAEMWQQIPKERRDMSGARSARGADAAPTTPAPESAPGSNSARHD